MYIGKKETMRLQVSLCVILTLASCRMIESHPYDVNITGACHLTEKNIALIESQTAGAGTIRFAMISDTQRRHDETKYAVRALNARTDIDFVLHGGDITEYGATKEFLWQRDILQNLKVPYLTVIGNHDCIATGVETYKKVFGPLDYAFTAGNVRFICVNNNALEFPYDMQIPDLDFVRYELEAMPEGIEKTVVLMHAGPETEQFNGENAEEFHRLIKNFPGLQFCIYGHGHHVSVDDFHSDGIIYYECASIDCRSYLLFTIKEEGGYDYEVVDF